MDSVMSVYKPHGGHDCGGHGHDHGHGHGHSHGGHDHGGHDHAAPAHNHDHGHEGHNHGAGGCSGHNHGTAPAHNHGHTHNNEDKNEYAEILPENQTEQEYMIHENGNIRVQMDSIISSVSIPNDVSPGIKGVENPL